MLPSQLIGTAVLLLWLLAGVNSCKFGMCTYGETGASFGYGCGTKGWCWRAGSVNTCETNWDYMCNRQGHYVTCKKDADCMYTYYGTTYCLSWPICRNQNARWFWDYWNPSNQSMTLREPVYATD